MSPEEPTTPDLEEMAGRFFDALARRDLDAAVNFLTPQATWDAVGVGNEHLRGQAAIRRFLGEWLRPYEQFETDVEEVLGLGKGVVLCVAVSKGRLFGATGLVQIRLGFVGIMDGDHIERLTSYADVDEARADAERLAEERG